MGGSAGFMNGMFNGGAMQAPQTPPQYTNSQLMDYARSNNGNFGELDKYGKEIVTQLQNGSYKDPAQVWQAVRDQGFNSGQGGGSGIAAILRSWPTGDQLIQESGGE